MTPERMTIVEKNGWSIQSVIVNSKRYLFIVCPHQSDNYIYKTDSKRLLSFCPIKSHEMKEVPKELIIYYHVTERV